VASLPGGDELSLARLAKSLRLREKELLKLGQLNVYKVAIWRNEFLQAFG
jgi:hypothetical protein